MPAWGDIVNSLLLNRQRLESNQLNMMDTAMTIMGRQQRQQIIEREDQATRSVLGSFLQGGTTAFDKSLIPSDNDTPITAASKQVRLATQQAQDSRMLAKRLLDAGAAPDLAERYITDARLADQRAITAQRELRLEQTEQARRVGSIAASATPDNLEQIVSALDKESPDIVKGLPLDRAPDGSPMWGEKTQRAFATLASQGQTVTQKFESERKAQDELLKQQRENRQFAADQRREALANAQISHLQAATKKLEEAQNKVPGADRAASVAAAPASSTAIKSARSAILSTDTEAEWQASSLDAFAADVADRANKIRADAMKDGNDMSLDDAREQAIGELRSHVKTEMHGGIWKTERKVYSRPMAIKSAAPKNAEASPEATAFMEVMRKRGYTISSDLPQPMPESEAKAKKGQVYQTAHGLALWDGTKFVQ